MRSLDTAHEACDRYHPGLLKALAELPLLEREKPGSPIIDLFRAHGGAGLIVPSEYGGQGADPLEAVRVLRAIGSHSPSLGAAATMHHFTAATMFALDSTRLTARQDELLRRVAGDRLLMSSGWAEGRTEQNILNPTMTATPAPGGGYLVNGAKKPCSLSRSMDLLTLGVTVIDPDGEPDLAMMVVPADTAGITVHPFWSSELLAAAESDEVRLTDVHVSEDLVIRATADDPERFNDLQVAGFIWFELLITSAYTGAASALVSQVLERGRGAVADRSALAVTLEAAVGLVEGTARAIRDGDISEDTVAATLVARYTVQDLLADATAKAVELLGGMAFIGSNEIAHLSSATRPLAFHPPSRTSVAPALADFFAGGPLVLA